MSDVYKALADPTRRAILDELSERDGQTLFELCTRLATRHGLGSSRCCPPPPSTRTAGSSPGSTGGGWSRRCSLSWSPSGSTDLLFALDSIPAVFGVTEEPFLVFAANAFALLGLRALFFLVQGLLDRLVYLSTGLAVVFAFIGVKLVLHWGHTLSDAVPELPTLGSLVVIMAILAVTVVASLVKTRSDPAARAHAGSLRAQPSSPDPESQPDSSSRS